MRNFAATCRASLMLVLCVLLTAPAFAFEDQVEELARQIAAEAEGKQSIAVVDFTDLQGNVFELGRFLAEELSVALAKSDQNFELVDRTHLASIIREHKLSQTGLIDPQTAREVGKIVGVEALVTGTLTQIGENVRVVVKLLDTESARVIGSGATMIPMTGAIETLAQKEISNGPTTADHSGRQQQEAGDGSSEEQAQKFTAKVAGIEFGFEECTLSRYTSRLTCSLLLTVDEEMELTINSRSKVFDSSGGKYYYAKVYLGRQASSEKITSDLRPGMPTRLEFQFRDLPKSLTEIPTLELVCYLAGVGFFKAKLHDLPVRRL